MSLLNRRDDQIATLKARTDKLDAARLEQCYRNIVLAYERDSIVDRLANVDEQTDRTPSGFRVLTNQETRLLAHFNDPTYYWEMYCEQLGRSIALWEERYVFEKIAELPGSALTVDGQNPRFAVIEEAVQEVRSRGHKPSAIFAPISLFVPFQTDSALQIDWGSDPHETLVMADGTRLPVIWSSNAAPLNRFVIADTSAGIWNVKLDPETHHRLTVAIGRPESPPEAVVFLAETVAKYEVVDPNGFYVVEIVGQPREYGTAEGE